MELVNKIKQIVRKYAHADTKSYDIADTVDCVMREVQPYVDTQDSLLETYGEMVHNWVANVISENNKPTPGRLLNLHIEEGVFAVYQELRSWAREFEAKYKGTDWGIELDWVDTVAEFMKQKNSEV